MKNLSQDEKLEHAHCKFIQKYKALVSKCSPIDEKIMKWAKPTKDRSLIVTKR